MADELIARFRRWFEYERDAHAHAFSSLDTVPIERRSGAEYRKAVAILGHIVGAREVWLVRLGVIPAAPQPFFLVNDPPLDRVLAEWRTVEAAWTAYLAKLSSADLDRVFEYQSYDAGRFRNSVEEVLTQLFGHSWYHRGQIAMLVRAAGGVPAVTDLIYWCRQPVET